MNIRPGILLILLALGGNGIPLLPASESKEQLPASDRRSLTIQEAVQMALAHSPEIHLAEAQVQKTKESLRETRSLNLPQVTAGTGLAYNNGFPLSIEGSAPSLFNIAASQSLFSSKNSNLIREAKESLKASDLGSNLSQNDLAYKTALVYYQLFQAGKVLTLAADRLAAARTQRDLIESSLDAGKVRPVDAITARTAVASAEQQLLVAREQARVAEAELRELTGIPATTSILTMDPVIQSPMYDMEAEALYLETVSSSPQIQQAEAMVKAKEYHVKAEKGERWPRLDAVSEYALFSRSNNYEDYYRRFERHNYLIGLSVQVPLFNGFRTSARVTQSKHEASEERYRLDRLKSDLKINIQKGLSALRIARGASEVARIDLEAARELLQVNTVLLEGGRIGAKELADTQLQLQQKELTRLEADQNMFQRQMELLRLTGSLVPAIRR